MTSKELKQIAKNAERTLRLYINGDIQKDQINDVFHMFSHSGPNCWPSRIVNKLMNNEDWNGAFEDDLGKDYKRILDLFVQSPAYLINNHPFNIEIARGIIIGLSHIADELEIFEKKGKKVVFETSL